MNYSRSTLVVFIILVLICRNGYAQAPPPPPPGLPIDGGLSFLVLSGVIYGIYETLKRR